MHTVLNVFLIILTIVVVLLAVLYFVGRRLQKKQSKILLCVPLCPVELRLLQS